MFWGRPAMGCESSTGARVRQLGRGQVLEVPGSLVVRMYKMWAEYLAQTSLSTNGPCSVIRISISVIIMINGRIKTSQ